MGNDAGEKWRTTTIEMLSEHILLEIFDFYRLVEMDSKEFAQMIWPWRRSSPWPWHRLAHVCRKWRQVISISPCRLDLLDCRRFNVFIGRQFSVFHKQQLLWIAVRFDTGRKTKLISRNIMVAFHRPDRLREISLNVPSSIIGPIIELIQYKNHVRHERAFGLQSMMLRDYRY